MFLGIWNGLSMLSQEIHHIKQIPLVNGIVQHNYFKGRWFLVTKLYSCFTIVLSCGVWGPYSAVYADVITTVCFKDIILIVQLAPTTRSTYATSQIKQPYHIFCSHGLSASY